MAASPDAVLHLAALHTLASAGFASTSRAASMTLSGVLAKYLQLVASSCTERAALAGRSKVAAIDVVNALDDLGVGGITELQEWSLDLDKEVTFTGGRLDDLAGYLRDGLSVSEGQDRCYVPVESEDEDDEERSDVDVDEDKETRARPETSASANGHSPRKSASSVKLPSSESPKATSADPVASSSPKKESVDVKTEGPANAGSPEKVGSPTKAASPLVKVESPEKMDAEKAEGAGGKADKAKEDDIAKPAIATDAEPTGREPNADGDVQMEDATKDEDATGESDAANAKGANGSADSKDDGDKDSDNAMDVDEAPRARSPQLPTPPPSPPYLRVDYRPRSPDMSWLPPLPTADMETVTDMQTDTGETGAAPAPQSIADRYRQPVAFRSSQLAESRATFVDPPKPSGRPLLPEAPTSFPYLVAAYEATATEPSVALRQTDGRRQAADLLRLTVGNPDRFSTRDTLVQSLPPPQISPIVPSHSDTLPSRLIPVNPVQTGIISSILHQIRSPYLPPTLRERLTSLRPPQAQTNEQGPILFGDPIRGADDAHLAKARGKATGDEPTAVFRATWDAGPRGSEKWAKGRLPTGRKVTKQGVGPSQPREPGKGLRLKISERNPSLNSDPGTPAFSPATTLKLRLGAPRVDTPTADRARPSPLADSTGTGTPSSSMPPIRLFARPPAGSGSSPKRKRSASPRKTSMSPVKQEPMHLD